MVTFSAVLSAYLLLRARSQLSFANWLGAGAMLGASVLIRTTMLPFAIAAVVWIVVFGSGPWRRKLLRGSIVFLAFALLVGAWLERNYLLIGRAVLTSEAGDQFWMAHNPQTFSRYPHESIDRSAEVAFAALSPSEMQELEALSADEMGRSDWFLRKGLDYAWQNPGETLLGSMRKVATGFSWVLNPVREPFAQFVYFISYAPISILGLLGMVLARRGWREHSLIYLQFFAFILVSAIFWAHTSHRTFLDVYLIIFSAFAIKRVIAHHSTKVRITVRARDHRHRCWSAAAGPVRRIIFASLSRGRWASKCRTNSPVPCIARGMSGRGGPAMASWIH